VDNKELVTSNKDSINKKSGTVSKNSSNHNIIFHFQSYPKPTSERKFGAVQKENARDSVDKFIKDYEDLKNEDLESDLKEKLVGEVDKEFIDRVVNKTMKIIKEVNEKAIHLIAHFIQLFLNQIGCGELRPLSTVIHSYIFSK